MIVETLAGIVILWWVACGAVAFAKMYDDIHPLAWPFALAACVVIGPLSLMIVP